MGIFPGARPRLTKALRGKLWDLGSYVQYVMFNTFTNYINECLDSGGM